ncbi:hypothetical protein Calag_1277 [Caldisphaera lagunensis DSM 15908]|uniref:Uncharacterized protein n=1 Tax=Caldisphaera lagunensis (strain DSM 15908 / JCM 11604 / ANMR 0165 / IC-154) TaxID=1056495 RepID=L0AAS9_CALLD|nr:hypothetical protein Calag_1277 [Caldisphaera lagunensis DSM 15908]
MINVSDGKSVEEVEEEKVISDNLSVIYEDTDLVVYTAPNEEELKDILLDLLRKNGKMSIKDFHRYLSGLASEDKIRYALNELLKDEAVIIDRQGYFYSMELLNNGEYSPEEVEELMDNQPDGEDI